MPNVYADLATLKSASVLNAPDDSHDARLLDLLEAASRWIDGYCDRRFSVLHATRKFDGGGGDTLMTPDLISVDTLRVMVTGGAWQDWPADRWLLYPLRARPTQPDGNPFTRIVAVPGTGLRFVRGKANVAVAGLWGYVSLLDATGLQVSIAASVGAAQSTITVSDAGGGAVSGLSPGNTIRIGGEQLYVNAVVLASDGASADLAVKRGVNGTTAAVHRDGEALSVYRYPTAITEACLLQATAWWLDRAAAPFSAPGIGGIAESDGIDRAARRLLEPYKRRSASLGV